MGPLLAAFLSWMSATPGEAAVDPECRRWITETEIPAEPRLIKHKVHTRESLAKIAARYGVKAADIAEWNELRSGRARVRPGRKLKIHARRIPPPPEKIQYAVKPGDTWMEIAIRHRVDLKDLRAWNWKLKTKDLKPGTKLMIWRDPGMPRTVNCERGLLPYPLQFRQNGESVGRPNYGMIKRGVQLPDSPLYTRRDPNVLWASSHTVRQIEKAFSQLRSENGYRGDVMIGSISRPRGRRFPPHRSHQSGRDIDIRLPTLPGVPEGSYPHADIVDWSATWELIEAFIDTGEVSMIFLDYKLQRRLYQAARWEGKTEAELDPIIHWPERKQKWAHIVQHSRGHVGHIHVRLLCGAHEARCRPKREEQLKRLGRLDTATPAPKVTGP
ncbi:MAG: penicillin-insensitive murein endopeptidase [Nannocystaceae bacterium]|nr:penicillin-insensitive murein endopeptidase [Myxococcales bacterium]